MRPSVPLDDRLQLSLLYGRFSSLALTHTVPVSFQRPCNRCACFFDGISFYVAAPLCFFCHSSGVKHFGVQACMAAISAFNAELTSRCRAKVVFFSNCEETIMALKAWPQPPVPTYQLYAYKSTDGPITRHILDVNMLGLKLLLQSFLYRRSCDA